jgi:hypothetical protein
MKTEQEVFNIDMGKQTWRRELGGNVCFQIEEAERKNGRYRKDNRFTNN